MGDNNPFSVLTPGVWGQPKPNRQQTLCLHDLCVGVLTVQVDELLLFWHIAFLMSLIMKRGFSKIQTHNLPYESHSRWYYVIVYVRAIFYKFNKYLTVDGFKTKGIDYGMS